MVEEHPQLMVQEQPQPVVVEQPQAVAVEQSELETMEHPQPFMYEESQPLVSDQLQPTDDGNSEPSNPYVVSEESTATSDPLPLEGYLSAEEIFKAAEREQRQQSAGSYEADGGIVDWLLAGLFPESSGTSGTLTLIPLLAGCVVVFLSLYYLKVQQSSREQLLLAKISHLDAQLYETRAANEEFGTYQEKISQLESEVTELKSRNEHWTEEKDRLEAQLSRALEDNESLEKELESATESGLEANKMINVLLSQQGESSDLQRSVEFLQEKLLMQQNVMESLDANLSAKAAESERLQLEVDELRDSSEKYQVRLKSLSADLETLKTSNRNYLQKLSHDESELLKLKKERGAWSDERRSLSSQLSLATKEAAELRDKVNQWSTLAKSREGEISVLTECLERLQQTNNNGTSSGGTDSIDGQPQDGAQLTSLIELVQVKAQQVAACQEVDQLKEQLQVCRADLQRTRDDKQELERRLNEWKEVVETAAKDKMEAETRLEVRTETFFLPTAPTTTNKSAVQCFS